MDQRVVPPARHDDDKEESQESLAREQAALDLWRQQVQAHVRSRLASYEDPGSEATKKTTAPKPLEIGTREHQVLCIPELLSLILQYAGARSQMVALDVSELWRSCAISVVGSSVNIEGFRFPGVCEPVEYGQPLSLELSELKAGPDEIGVFREHLHRLLEQQENALEPKYVYCPARLTQQRDLPDDITQALDALDFLQSHATSPAPVIPVPRNSNLAWLDLSQVQINPYFNHLFTRTNRIQHSFGRWQITLRSPSDEPLLKRTPNTNILINAIGSMLMTYPPCKTLGIYHCVLGAKAIEAFPSRNCLISRVRNDNGIRVSDMMNALELCALVVVSDWKRDVGRFHDRSINESDWTEDIWSLPATPTILVCMDNSEMSDADFDYVKVWQTIGMDKADELGAARMGFPAHVTRVAYMTARPSRAIREGEWLPQELFDPIMTATGRSSVDWNT